MLMKQLRSLLMAMLIALANIVTAQTNIVVLSDIHVMGPGLLVNDGEAWQNAMAADRKLIGYSRPLLDEMVSRIKAEGKAQLVLITGDLTKDGERLSHEYVKSKLDELKAAGIPSLVIPGNHDLGTGNALYYDGAATTPAEVVDSESFASLYADYGYGSTSERDDASLSYACEPVDGLVVIGIDTGGLGVIAETTLEWICQQARTAREAGKQVVALMHHPLMTHVYNSELFFDTTSIFNSDHVRLSLIDAGIKVVFSGHVHTSDIAKDFSEDLTKEIYDVNTGSLASYPCDYREVTLNRDLTQMSIATGHVTSIEGDDVFNSEYAKEHLHNAIKTRVRTRILESVSNPIAQALLATLAECFSTTIADAFIIHAEGNEAEVNTQQIFNNLAPVFLVVSNTKDLMSSMLYDLAPYGAEGRENKTDDLSLTIALPSEVATAISHPSLSATHHLYDLQGRKTIGTPQRKGIFVLPSSSGSHGSKIIVK